MHSEVDADFLKEVIRWTATSENPYIVVGDFLD